MIIYCLLDMKLGKKKGVEIACIYVKDVND